MLRRSATRCKKRAQNKANAVCGFKSLSTLALLRENVKNWRAKTKPTFTDSSHYGRKCLDAPEEVPACWFDRLRYRVILVLLITLACIPACTQSTEDGTSKPAG